MLATFLAGGTVLVVAAVTCVLTGSTGFSQVLNYQSNRGLQIESLAALPLVLAEPPRRRRLRHALRLRGLGDHRPRRATELATLATVAFAIGLAAVFLAHWRLMRKDARPRGVALTGVTLLLVILATNKVFSPQYVLWLLAVVAAAAILDPRTCRSPTSRPVLVLCGLTQIVFPLFYGDVLTDACTG